MAMSPQVNVPAPDDANGLHMAAVDHLFVGTRNATQLAEEPLMLVGSDGIYVDDIEGNRYIDGIGGMYFRNTGHGRDEVALAIYEQLKDVSMHVYAGSTPSTVRLAAKLAEVTPGDLTKTFFTSGGSESNESALKLAPLQGDQPQGLLPRRDVGDDVARLAPLPATRGVPAGAGARGAYSRPEPVPLPVWRGDARGVRRAVRQLPGRGDPLSQPGVDIGFHC